MGLFLLRRLSLVVPILGGLVVLIFVLTRMMPGDPAALLAGDNATAASIAKVRTELGLDQPLPVQAWRYLKQIASGDLGISTFTQRSIADDILEKLPATVELASCALLLAILLGVPLGMISASQHNRPLDHLIRPINVLGLAIAPFWMALTLQLLFAMKLDILPLQGQLAIGAVAPPRVTGFIVLDSLLAGQFRTALDGARHLLLPAITLALPAMATLARFTRSSALEVLQQDFVAYARSMGLPWRKIFWKYVLRNSLSATVTQIGLLTGAMMSGSVVVEALFVWPGLGHYLFNAITTSDYQPVIATTLAIGLIYAVVNVMIDMLQGVIDPRIMSKR